MTIRFKGRFGKELAWYLVAGAICLLIAYKLPLSVWHHAPKPGAARVMGAVLALGIELAVVVIHMIMRPVLVLDSSGARVERGLRPFNICWDDVEAIGDFRPNGGKKTLGFKLDPGSAGASLWRRAQTGYDQILPNEWGVPLYEIEAAMRKAIGEVDSDQPLSPSEERAWLNTPQTDQPVFGHRATV